MFGSGDLRAAVAGRRHDLIRVLLVGVPAPMGFRLILEAEPDTRSSVKRPTERPVSPRHRPCAPTSCWSDPAAAADGMTASRPFVGPDRSWLSWGGTGASHKIRAGSDRDSEAGGAVAART